MKVNPVSVTAFEITEVQSLDPIQVIMQDLGDSRGRIIIQCYGESWTAAWSAMGGRSLSRFFVDCDTDYLIDNLSRHRGRLGKAKREYLWRIVAAVRAALITTDPAQRVPTQPLPTLA